MQSEVSQCRDEGPSDIHSGLDASAFLSPPQAPDEIGRLGPYRVLRLIGQGGMGAVLRAEDSALQRPVALKVMLPDAAGKPSARERFLRELASGGPGSITTTSSPFSRSVKITASRSWPCNFSRACPWRTSFGERFGDPSGRILSPGRILKLGREIANGLAAAHAKGLIHRDVKPANIWLVSNAGGRVKILDFGLAHPSKRLPV